LYDYSSHNIKRYEFIGSNITRCAYAPRHLASVNALIGGYQLSTLSSNSCRTWLVR